MNQKQIDIFFKELDQQLNASATIIITGAGAGALMGNIRPSLDIDFEIQSRVNADRLEKTIDITAKKIGIAANYAEDISRWSMIEFLDYRSHALPYKKMGKLKIKLMSPDYWTIGKMTRYLATDIDDMIRIIRKKKLKVTPLIQLWVRALNKSKLSLSKGSFKDHINDFLLNHGKKIWGLNFEPLKNMRQFENKIKR